MHEVIAALRRHARCQPDTIAFADKRTGLGWRELARRVAGAAGQAATLPPAVGLLAGNGVDWVVCDLALAAAGRTFVPLPTMFSDAQLAHVAATAEVGCIVADDANMARARRLCDRVIAVPRHLGEHIPDGAADARRVIFTSGSTGAPRGVVHGNRQLSAMAAALARAISADAGDRYLSLLPFALLLEALCAIHVPVLVGGRCDIASGAAAALAAGRLPDVAATIEDRRPTVTVLVPELLRAWVADLDRSDTAAPRSLRVVAVGGAPVPPPVAQAAWARGIPVHEGYGLSECCSVVALNRPGARMPGTVGKPLDGLDVRVEAGEIVVRGPTVMDGYLGGAAADGVWRTGDLGRFDAAGNLIVDGRRDNLLVTAFGRNVQAEWIETLLAGDPRVGQAIVFGHGAPDLGAVIVPSPGSGPMWREPDTAAAVVRAACRDVPGYAVPKNVFVADGATLAAAGLLTPTGRPRRRAIAAHFTLASESLTAAKDLSAA